MMMDKIGDIKPCTDCDDYKDKICGMCNGCGAQRLEEGHGGWVLWVPNSLTKEEVIARMKHDIDVLCNNFKLTS